MKLLIVGCGSIGQRHAKNASEVAKTAVVDNNLDNAAEVSRITGAKSFGNDLANALNWKPDGVIVSVPHKFHVKVASQVIEAGIDVLIEKPLSHNLVEANGLLKKAKLLGRNIYVVCNMRFHPAVQMLKKYLPYIGRPLFARAHYGNYLPDMRPNVDYRTLYVADAEEGGVVLDGIHEIDYLSWLLGPVQSCIADTDQISDLEIEAEDYSCMVLQHKSKVRSEIHLDYLRRFKRRGCEIVGSDGSLDWLSEGKNPEQCKVRLYTSDAGWRTLVDLPSIDQQVPFKILIATFIEALNGEKTDLHTGYEARQVLKIALDARAKESQI